MIETRPSKVSTLPLAGTDAAAPYYSYVTAWAGPD
jgi:hypothetical protein